MIQFNELRIDSNKNLIIDASVLDLVVDPGNLITINHIWIGVGTNTNLIDLFPLLPSTGEDEMFPRVDRVPNSSGGESIRGFRFTSNVLPTDSGNLEDWNKNLIYIKIEVDITQVPDIMDSVSCAYKDYIEGCVYDKCLIVSNVFDYIKQSGSECGDISGLANYIAKIKSLELTLEGGNFTLANKYWNTFFRNNQQNFSTSNCCCK